MPRLKIPEKIDMAIDVASLGAKRMVLSWQAMLNAVAMAPHTMHTAKMAMIYMAAACINSRHSAGPSVTTNMNLRLPDI